MKLCINIFGCFFKVVSKYQVGFDNENVGSVNLMDCVNMLFSTDFFMFLIVLNLFLIDLAHLS